MNNLLNLNFLNTTYITYLKNLSFIVGISVMICVIFLLLKFLFNKKYEFWDGSCNLLLVISFIAVCLEVIVLFLSFVLLPACYLSALIKDVLMARYLYTPELLTFSREIIINIISAFIGVIPYTYIIARCIKNFARADI